MSLGDRLGVLGAILTLFGIAASILWPDKKWLGWASLVAAVILLGTWAWLETKSQFPVMYEKHPIKTLCAVFIGGGLLSVLFVLLLDGTPKRQQVESSEDAEKSQHTVKLVPPSAGWMPEWGQQILPHGVRSIVDVSTMIQYHKPIPLMLIYRIDDKSIEEQGDTRIVKSNIFHVAQEPRLTVDVQLPDDFIESGIQKKLRESGEFLPGKYAVTVPMKVALVALPKSAKPDDISKISDAAKLGGGVLAINGFPFSVEASVTKQHP